MSNSHSNREQSTLFIQTPNQLNPGAARPEDFKVKDRDGGPSQRQQGRARCTASRGRVPGQTTSRPKRSPSQSSPHHTARSDRRIAR